MAASWANEASSSSSSTPPQWVYDVFLSFRGVDTRNTFISHLLAALKQHGFSTFRDDKELKRGEYINDALMKAIEESRVLVIVFSKNYAESRWCLEELVKIMDCQKTSKQTVVPIFCDVTPSDVRAQKGSLEKAFAKHEERYKEDSDGNMKKWREALTAAANLSGYDLLIMNNRDEAELIKNIVEEVGKIVDRTELKVADHEVGLESRLQKLKKLLSLESSDVRIVGIWGIGGIGKTTIANKLYNCIQHEFDSSSFLANVRETSQQKGLVVLQNQLLSEICGSHNVSNCDHGITVIKRRAFCRKVLLILDDVSDIQQLKALAICRNSFVLGSRIIITTRDRSLLYYLGVKENEIYALEVLDKDESFELFNWHAFKEDHPTYNHLKLSKQVVDYAGGLPLALEVLGSCLSCHKTISKWKSAIIYLKEIHHGDIQGKLKISYDLLSDEDKQLFLDIACFFAGTNRDFTVKILEGRYKSAKIRIEELENRCLIKYKSINKQLVMHDLLQEMGRDIVKKESPEEPGLRSRLWHHEDVFEVMRDGTGTEAVKGILLNNPQPNSRQVNANAFEKTNRLWHLTKNIVGLRDGMETEAIEVLPNFLEPNYFQVNGEVFKKMKRLWLLRLNYVHLTTGYEHISKRLLWLSWNGFCLECMPLNLSMENLVALDLRYSRLKQVWKENKVMVNLRFLYLSHCYYLTRTPDFSGLNNLEEVWLNDCIRLVEVDESISNLHKLLFLNMSNCKKLQKLPSGMRMLKSVKSLDLSGCSSLGKLSEFRGSLSNLFSFLSSWMPQTKRVDSIGLSLSTLQGLSWLTELRMRDCNMSGLPDDIGNLISLHTLDLGGNNFQTIPNSIGKLTSLKQLDLDRCNVSYLPSEIGGLISLKTLCLQENNLRTLPYEIGRLISLEWLDLGRNSLRTLPNSICDLTRLEDLFLSGCNLSSLPSEIGRLVSLRFLGLAGSDIITLPDSIINLTGLRDLDLQDCARLQSLPNLSVKYVYAHHRLIKRKHST